MITGVSGSQYKLQNDAKCDTFGALWRMLGANTSAQRVFGETTGFSLLLTTLHSFQLGEEHGEKPATLLDYLKVFIFLLRVMTAGVCNNAINRLRLHTVLSSQTFYDLLCESGLLCVDCEKQVIQVLLELALEIVLPPSTMFQTDSSPTSDNFEEYAESFLSSASLNSNRFEKERVYNASAIAVLIRSLLLFTPKVQLDILTFVEKLSEASPFNQENLTSVGERKRKNIICVNMICVFNFSIQILVSVPLNIGCVGLLLETVSPFLLGSSSLLTQALRIVEILGSYRLVFCLFCS